MLNNTAWAGRAGIARMRRRLNSGPASPEHDPLSKFVIPGVVETPQTATRGTLRINVDGALTAYRIVTSREVRRGVFDMDCMFVPQNGSQPSCNSNNHPPEVDIVSNRLYDHVIRLIKASEGGSTLDAVTFKRQGVRPKVPIHSRPLSGADIELMNAYFRKDENRVQHFPDFAETQPIAIDKSSYAPINKLGSLVLCGSEAELVHEAIDKYTTMLGADNERDLAERRAVDMLVSQSRGA